MSDDERRERLRDLPSVDRLATAVARAELADAPRGAARRRRATTPDLVDARAVAAAPVAAARAQRDRRRRAHEPRARAARRGGARRRSRAPRTATRTSSSTSRRGERGSRHDHVEELLRELTGAEAALAVNNCAAAMLLAAAALAGGRELVVSRGQLDRDRRRLPDPRRRRARPARGSSRSARRTGRGWPTTPPRWGPTTGAILRAHPSNFRTVGFVEAVEIEELCGLGVPVIDDVGSGVLADDIELLAGEPPVRRSVRAGAALVCFSGDKLLGGPQAGLLVGARDAIDACRRHPLARARADRQALARRARGDARALPRPRARRARRCRCSRCSTRTRTTLAARARAARGRHGRRRSSGPVARVGGGALPLLELHGPAVALDPGPAGADALAAALRAGDPPLVGRIQDDRLLLDPRTLADAEAEVAAQALAAALASGDP